MTSVTTSQLCTALCYKRLLKLLNKKTHYTEKKIVFTRSQRTNETKGLIRNCKLRAGWDNWNIPSAGNISRNGWMQNTVIGGCGSFYSKHRQSELSHPPVGMSCVVSCRVVSCHGWVNHNKESSQRRVPLLELKVLQAETIPRKNVWVEISWQFVYLHIVPTCEFSEIENVHLTAFISVSWTRMYPKVSGLSQ
jgi:hypothetical protein